MLLVQQNLEPSLRVYYWIIFNQYSPFTVSLNDIWQGQKGHIYQLLMDKKKRKISFSVA